MADISKPDYTNALPPVVYERASNHKVDVRVVYAYDGIGYVDPECTIPYEADQMFDAFVRGCLVCTAVGEGDDAVLGYMKPIAFTHVSPKAAAAIVCHMGTDAPLVVYSAQP